MHRSFSCEAYASATSLRFSRYTIGWAGLPIAVAVSFASSWTEYFASVPTKKASWAAPLYRTEAAIGGATSSM